MAHTKRNEKRFGEVLRSAKPYKRPRHSDMLKEFEQEYIRRNRNPQILL